MLCIFYAFVCFIFAFQHNTSWMATHGRVIQIKIHLNNVQKHKVADTVLVHDDHMKIQESTIQSPMPPKRQQRERRSQYTRCNESTCTRCTVSSWTFCLGILRSQFFMLKNNAKHVSALEILHVEDQRKKVCSNSYVARQPKGVSTWQSLAQANSHMGYIYDMDYFKESWCSHSWSLAKKPPSLQEGSSRRASFIKARECVRKHVELQLSFFSHKKWRYLRVRTRLYTWYSGWS